MVAAPWQPLLRITHAALPVKAANRTLPSTPSARCLASVVLPVPAYPKRRKIEARPRAALSQFEAAVRAASWWGVKIGIGGQKGRSASIKKGTGTIVKKKAYNSATEANMDENVVHRSIPKFLKTLGVCG